MADIEEGLYITEMMGMGVNIVTGDYSRGASGFRIEKGEITTPIRGMIDFAKGAVVPFEDLIDEMLEHVAEDAEALGCVKELAGVREILSRGTSAHRQLKVYELERASGASDEDGLKAVVDTLIRDTAEGLKT